MSCSNATHLQEVGFELKSVLAAVIIVLRKRFVAQHVNPSVVSRHNVNVMVMVNVRRDADAATLYPDMLAAIVVCSDGIARSADSSHKRCGSRTSS